jgi:hypothetical protein
VIERESSLLVANEHTFRVQFGIDVRTRCEAIEISPAKKAVKLRDVATSEVTTHPLISVILQSMEIQILGK